MAIEKDRAVQRRLSTLFTLGAIGDLTDGQLLERFLTGEGEAAELAFAALVERHGAMVLRVCRARAGDANEALDAFQATFLVLIKKSRGLWVKDSLGPWLHQVAYRTASRARNAQARRRRAERTAAEITAASETPHDGDPCWWEQTLQEEINRLPERYRSAIVLCDLEGNTCEEAARKMGRPVGTVKCWRSRGRERLRLRLIRRGVTLTAGAGLALSGRAAPGAVLAARAARTLLEVLSTGVVPGNVRAMVTGVAKAMILDKLKMAATVVLALVVATGGLGTAARLASGASKRQTEQIPVETLSRRADKGEEVPWVPGRHDEGVKRLTLRSAIHDGLFNTGMIRLVEDAKTNVEQNKSTDRFAVGIMISPVGPAASLPRFQAELTAVVSSIERSYWKLSERYVELWAAENAVDAARDVLKRTEEREREGRATEADILEARARLERLNLDLVAKTSDSITAERVLREVMSLPLADSHRLLPVTAPLESRLAYAWDACIEQMKKKHPDIAEAKLRLREKAVRETREAREPFRAGLDDVTRAVIPDLLGAPSGTSSSITTAGTLAANEAEHLDQVTQGAERSLGRAFREIPASYNQCQEAKKLRSAAAERLEVQRGEFERGRIANDRFLDALSEYAHVVASEAEARRRYNNAIVALEVAKGTLLEYHNITLVPFQEAAGVGTTPPTATAPTPTLAATSQTKTGGPSSTSARPSSQPDSTPAHSGAPRGKSASKAQPGTPKRSDAAGDAVVRTASFDFRINLAGRPVEISGSFTIRPAAPEERTQSR